MKQIRFDAFGPPHQVANCVDVPDVGQPSSWDVIVDILAFPINPADLWMLSGEYAKRPPLPSTIGAEAVGTITAKGDAVKDLQIGDRVILLANNNWAQRRKVAAGMVKKVPSAGDPLQWAMLKVNPATALMLLRDMVELQPGDWVIHSGARSAVGLLINELARTRGLRTIGVVREERAGVAPSGQPDVTLVDGPDLASKVAEITDGASPTLALDAVGGAATERLADCLAEGGVIAMYGMLANEPTRLRPDQTIFKNITLRGFWLTRYISSMTKVDRENLYGELIEHIGAGRLHSPIEAVYPIEAIKQALAHAIKPGRAGKILVTPNGPIGS